ncbi:MAG: isoprenylcysteine carboxylmethyltransferase family protein [Acidobacteria bacterium]|nr:isoprenylcysteine carboxylmethyltransferase family protein [Acidobacteriota bacterium]
MSAPPRDSFAGRTFALGGGVLFVGSIAYFFLAYRDFGQPAGRWTADGWTAVVPNVLLFTLFALHHSVFARIGFKAAIRARVSPALERAVYVWLSSLLFGLTLWAWTPVPGITWRFTGASVWLFELGCLTGVALTAVAASSLDPLELAGIRQAFGRPVAPEQPLLTTGPYRLVRHPIYLGWVLMVWCLPVMTGTRLVFATISTLYLVVAIPFEEREMRRTLGRAYDRYEHAVRWRILPGIY